MGMPTVRIGRRRGETDLPWAQLRLPPFPQVAIRVLQLVQSENVQLRQLDDLISSDAAFASEVLTVANSLLYSPRFPANSMLQAIAVLGANHLQGMCLTVAVRAYLGSSLSHPAMRSLWRHNLACALIAEQLASLGFIDKDVAYTAGVLHDIGRFALAVARPREYADLLGKHCGSSSSFLDAERELVGWDHCEVGRQLVLGWKLPDELEAVVHEHHCSRRHDVCWNMAELIKVSCKMADAAGFAAFSGCDPVAYDSLLEELPERERRVFPTDKEELAFAVAAKIDAIESV
jgi:putative nucleotidyltransferase with HDIG domain